MTKDNREISKNISGKEPSEKSLQLSLFQEIFVGNPDYSATMEVWDLCPKFWFGGVKREKGKYLNNIKKEFLVREKKFVVKISPASITKADGTTMHYYPSQREELVEEVIKKFLIQKKESFSANKGAEIGVAFSLYEVQKELKRMGHGYDLNDIKLAIDICSESLINIESEETGVSWKSAIFTSVGKKEELDTKKTKYVVTFSHLVVESINRNTFRPINYDTVMKYKMPLSRWIHKVISHYHTQLGDTVPYRCHMTTLVKNSPMKEYSKPSQTLQQVIKSLDEMVSVGTLERYEIEKLDLNSKIIPKEEEKGKKISDAKLYLYGTKEFIDDIIKANTMKNSLLPIDQKATEGDIEKVRSEMSNSVYGLSRTVIDNWAYKIKTKKNVEEYMVALSEAKKYIESQSECNAAAITQKALREKWKRKEKFAYFGGNSHESKKQSKEEKVSQDNPLWLKIRGKIEEEYVGKNWDELFSQLELFAVEDDRIILAVSSKFVRDTIKRDFLEQAEGGVMSLKEIISTVNSQIKKVEIECFQEQEN